MLIDFIDIEKLPDIIVWLDWQFYAAKYTLLFSIFFWIGHGYFITPFYAFQDVSLSILVGFCFWVLIRIITNGYAVG